MINQEDGAEKRITLGIWQQFPTPNMSRYLAQAGWDCIILDLQHGSMSFETAYECIHTIRAEGPKAFVRVAIGAYSEVQRALDLGARGIARLNRTQGRYRMTIIPAEFVELPREKMTETTEEWPHVFAKLPFDHNIFLDEFDANHCHAVYGDHVEELKMICKMLEVDVELLA